MLRQKGGISVDIGPTTDVKEKFKDWKKTISEIENTGKADCFVRVKVIAASQFDIQASGSNWSLSDDGYWYYSQVVRLVVKPSQLFAAITVSEKVKTSFNVVVVQECAPVTYDENGNPCVAPDAKWDATAQYDKEEGERVMKRKLPLILVASSAIMLAASMRR